MQANPTPHPHFSSTCYLFQPSHEIEESPIQQTRYLPSPSYHSSTHAFYFIENRSGPRLSKTRRGIASGGAPSVFIPECKSAAHIGSALHCLLAQRASRTDSIALVKSILFSRILNLLIAGPASICARNRADSPPEKTLRSI